MRRAGAEILCAEFVARDVRHVFGVPGSALVDVWEAIRRDSRIRVVGATSELTASFMANGYARATGAPAVLATISGPGVTFASSGIAEALFDSVPLVYVLDAALESTHSRADAMLSALVKGAFDALTAEDVAKATRSAFALAQGGDPGPVALRIAVNALESSTTQPPPPLSERPPRLAPTVDRLLDRLLEARRPVLLVGGGAARAAEEVRLLASRLTAPVLSTTSGRGVVSEDHALALVFDAPGASVAYVNQVLERADLVLALGCKLSRNGSRGYSLVLPAGRLVRVDISTEGLDRHYPASEEIEADVGVVVSALLEGLESSAHRSQWTAADIASIRDRVAAETPRRLDPRLGPVSARELFEALRRQLPRKGVVTTDSGQHQYVTRAHFRVVEPRTLMVPTGFQSMGFGLPAAIGAAIATGERSVAVVGDGGLAIVGLDIAIAVREGLPLTVVVLADGHFGLIRIAQRYRAGYDTGVDVAIPDLPTFAASLGADYAIFDGSRSADGLFAAAFASDAVTVVEVPMGEPPDLGRLTARGRLHAALRRSLGRSPSRLRRRPR